MSASLRLLSKHFVEIHLENCIIGLLSGLNLIFCWVLVVNSADTELANDEMNLVHLFLFLEHKVASVLHFESLERLICLL